MLTFTVRRLLSPKFMIVLSWNVEYGSGSNAHDARRGTVGEIHTCCSVVVAGGEGGGRLKCVVGDLLGWLDAKPEVFIESCPKIIV